MEHVVLLCCQRYDMAAGQAAPGVCADAVARDQELGAAGPVDQGRQGPQLRLKGLLPHLDSSHAPPVPHQQPCCGPSVLVARQDPSVTLHCRL